MPGRSAPDRSAFYARRVQFTSVQHLVVRRVVRSFGGGIEVLEDRIAALVDRWQRRAHELPVREARHRWTVTTELCGPSYGFHNSNPGRPWSFHTSFWNRRASSIGPPCPTLGV